jgi:hypothetical protein
MQRATLAVLLLFGLSWVASQSTPKEHKNFRLGAFVTPVSKTAIDVVAKSRKAYGSKKAELSNAAMALQAGRIVGRLVANLVGGPLSDYPNASAHLEW